MEPNRNPPCVYQQKAFLSSQGTPSGVHYEVTVTKAAPSFTLQISPQGDPSYDILLRKNQPIEFEWSGDEEGALRKWASARTRAAVVAWSDLWRRSSPCGKSPYCCYADSLGMGE